VTAPVWRTAASCANGNCVAVAHQPGEVWVRDSKLGDASPVLRFTAEEFEAFLDGVRDGEFDLPSETAGHPVIPGSLQAAPGSTETHADPLPGVPGSLNAPERISALRDRITAYVSIHAHGYDGARLDEQALPKFVDHLMRMVVEESGLPASFDQAGNDKPEVELIEVTVAEYDAALANDLANLGCTLTDLEAMAVTGDYESPMHRRLWLLIKPAPSVPAPPKETPNG
jgi:hypothetical protein